jgi:hypothetical protein
MTTIDTETYKGFEITSHYNKETKFFHASSKVGSSDNGYHSELHNICHGYENPKQAVEDVKIKIDEFLKTTPQNYEELADAITSSLVWPGYEDCYVDEQVLQILIENFIKLIK